ncbi:hypothetical protein CANMA_001188 [Candida margitis]|uniref:uncharacterized protein n=1 Tax=Candida margitis TaxID=1775924 RepID=UPI002227DF5B|nr:uncharacterized protein CANMA_001188 [Candida margitis]KAI5969726.1 hypothetical protein CANMA_001188 [Candida margitis]
MSLKSSIFSNAEASAKPPASGPNTTSLRSKSSSPYINGVNSSTALTDRRFDIKLRSKSSASPAPIPSTWNLDDLLEKYESTNNLPPPLSPTLPPQTMPSSISSTASSKRDPTKVQKKEVHHHTQLNAPTPTFPRSNLFGKDRVAPESETTTHGDSSSRRTINDKSTDEAAQFGDGAHNLAEDVPLLMLSPTLPASFNSNSHHANSKSLVASNGQTSKFSDSTKEVRKLSTSPTFKSVKTGIGVFKWINKMHDIAKPKFLVRIILNNKMKFKERVATSSSSPSSLSAFKISTSNKIDEASSVGTSLSESSRGTTRVLPKDIDIIEKNSSELPHLKKPQSLALVETSHGTDTARYEFIQEIQAKEKEIRKLLKIVEEKDRQSKDRLDRLKSLERDIEEERAGKQSSRNHANAGIFINEAIVSEHSSVLSESHLTKGQAEEVKTKFTKKKIYWLDICKDVQASVDILWKELELTRGVFPHDWKQLRCKSEDIQIIIMQVDIFIMKMVSLDYDERSKIVSNTLPSERSWKVLDTDVGKLITYIELLLASRESSPAPKDHQIVVEFLKTLKCLMFQTRALIVKRVNSILLRVVNTYIEKSSLTKDNVESASTAAASMQLSQKIIELQQQNLNNSERIQQLFLNSQPEYLNSMLASTFSYVWDKRTSNISRAQQAYNLNSFDKSIKPSLQTYYLPMGIYSNLNEVTCILFNLAVYFLEKYNKMNPSKFVNYKLQSGHS